MAVVASWCLLLLKLCLHKMRTIPTGVVFVVFHFCTSRSFAMLISTRHIHRAPRFHSFKKTIEIQLYTSHQGMSWEWGLAMYRSPCPHKKCVFSLRRPPFCLTSVCSLPGLGSPVAEREHVADALPVTSLCMKSRCSPVLGHPHVLCCVVLISGTVVCKASEG